MQNLYRPWGGSIAIAAQKRKTTFGSRCDIGELCFSQDPPKPDLRTPVLTRVPPTSLPSRQSEKWSQKKYFLGSATKAPATQRRCIFCRLQVGLENALSRFEVYCSPARDQTACSRLLKNLRKGFGL